MLTYHQRYYLRNKERITANMLKWREEHKEHYRAYQREVGKKYRKLYPLRKRLRNIKQRCEYKKDKKYKYYGGKGIKCLLTLKDLTFLWNRDNAQLLKQPSIDRIDGTGNYTLDNCRFIEMSENRKKRVEK